jgi:hypothetical protein
MIADRAGSVSFPGPIPRSFSFRHRRGAFDAGGSRRGLASSVALELTLAVVGLQREGKGDSLMARKYSKSASRDVERAMHKKKRGTLKSGRTGKKVTNRKQAIAIGLSEARKKGKKVPKKKAS